MEEKIYTFILIKITDQTYLGWSESLLKPKLKRQGNVEWIEWNKPLPEDIDEVAYRYENGELKAV